jgi:hypothetical protein
MVLVVMDDEQNHNNEDDNDQQLQPIVEEDEGEKIAAADTERRRLDLISLLQRKDIFLTRTRNKIDVLVKEFLDKTRNDIHEHLCNDNAVDSDNYHGLDSERDTEEEAETTIRLFPEVLSRKCRKGRFYPIQFLAYSYFSDSDNRCNLKAVSFIPLLVRLAIEFGSFDEELRGGLLIEGVRYNRDNALLLLTSSDRDFQNYNEAKNREHHELVDDKCLLVMKQLRKMVYLLKVDIQRYGLLIKLCIQDVFAEKRFRFLVEWDPIALTQTTEDGFLPLHYAAMDVSIQSFQLVFEYGIIYYPIKNGISLLFQKEADDDTPFQIACGNFGYEKVMQVVEDTLRRYHTSSDNNTPKFNIVENLMMAAIDEDVHLDCVYFLIRRQPDVLLKLLPQLSSSSSSQSPTSASAVVSSDDNNHNRGNSTKNGKRRREEHKIK